MIYPGIDVIELYERVVKAYEDDLSQLSYKAYVINDKERVYSILETTVVYVGLVNMSLTDSIQYTIVIEELIKDESFPFKACTIKKHFDCYEQIAIKYLPFHGIWAKPIREINDVQYRYVKPYRDRVDSAGKHFLVPSRAEIVNEKVPDLKLKERYFDWEGFMFHFIFYVYQKDDEVGYAELCISNQRIHKTARDRAKELGKKGGELIFALKRTDNKANQDFIRDCFGTGTMVQTGINCDRKMIDLLEKRYYAWLSLSPADQKRNKSCFRFSDGEIKYFYISKLIKSDLFSDLSKIGTELFKDVHAGKYLKCERYDYIAPINKWKSEQIVFELTKKAFPKYTVIYQHRPYFLKTNNGQMSYDVFISKLNIAIEYQGKQHFEPVEIFGGEENYQDQIKRDRLKRELSIQNGIKLVYICYWEDISIDLIKDKINEAMAVN